MNTRSYVTGGSTEAEHWPDPNKLADTLSASTIESCTTHNMLKATRYLIRWTGDPKYADYYQRAYFNGILGTQNPETGMLIYFMPMATGYTKTFGTPTDSFWCCYGTGIESFAKLGDSIYFHDDDGSPALYVNLFVASTVDWAEKGVGLEQRTSFPEEEGTTFIMHAERPATLALHVLVPLWATEGVQVKLNGEAMDAQAEPVSYLTIEREWHDGDTLQVSMPMRLYAHPMPDDPELVAIMYGPVVLAGLTQESTYVVTETPDPISGIEPVEGQPLTFLWRGHTSRATGETTDITLIPLTRVSDEPYGVYWVVTQEGSPRHQAILAAKEERARREARIVDRVVPNDEASEAAHGLQGENTGAGPFRDRAWRHAAAGGWWSWDLAVLPDVPMTLVCTYWGSDVPPRTFDILVDGEVIATQSLDRNRPGEFLEVEYEIPRELTEGKQQITVRFQAHEGNTAGGAFECATLRPEE